MVLVDSSVWVQFFYNKAPVADELDRLLSCNEVVSHDLVYGELMIGDTGGRKKLLDSMLHFEQAKTLPHDEVVQFVRSHSLQARGAGWIDIHLLASAFSANLPFWTADPRLRSLAENLKIAYSIPG